VVGIQVQGTDAKNYTANTTALSTANITPKNVTVLAVGKNKVYDGKITSLVTLSSGGVVKGDNFLLVGQGAFANANAGTVKAVAVTNITASGNDVGNYKLNNTTASTIADITPKIITVVATGTDKVYDGTTSDTVYLSSNDVLSQDLNNVQFTAAAAFTSKNVGVGKIVAVTNIRASGSQSGNYQLKDSTAKTYATVTAKNITVTASGSNKVYDASISGNVVLSSDGVFNGDTVKFASTSAVFSDKQVGNNKSVTVKGISLTGTDAKNYTANATALSTADITPKGLTVLAVAQDKVYDGTTTSFVILSSSGVIRGDSVSFTNAAASLDNKNVGTNKRVTVSGINALGTDARNYSVINTTAVSKATVTPSPITVVATGIDKVFDGNTNATVKLQSYGVILGDSLSFTSTAANFTSSAIGVNKTVKVSGISAIGIDANNYKLVKTTASTAAAITQR
jgi:hypothetical protein